MSVVFPRSKQNSAFRRSWENDVPVGRAGGRTAGQRSSVPRHAAEACIKQKPPLTQEPIPSFRFAASMTAFILIKRSDSSDGPCDTSQSAVNSSPNSMCWTTGF